MLKKILACSVVTLFVLVGSSSCFAADAGPTDITITGTNIKRPKPAQFPHKMHQDKLKCAECHHGMADGKQVAYTDGMEIQKCITCHNAEVLPGKKSGKLKLDTIKGAGHGNCLACHKKLAKADPALKAKKIAKCSTCHPKKKK
ncbi:MAG: class III cytochrome c [Desulfotalea sp.]|nr:MAG: class III cytochrome c [Desulfotalea sp.]